MALYALVLPISCFALCGLARTVGSVLVPLATLYALFCVGHAVVWWSIATDRYLRMDHPWGVGMAANVIAVLTVALIAAMVINLGSRSFLFQLLL